MSVLSTKSHFHAPRGQLVGRDTDSRGEVGSPKSQCSWTLLSIQVASGAGAVEHRCQSGECVDRGGEDWTGIDMWRAGEPNGLGFAGLLSRTS